MAKKQFKAESKRLLDLMINSIYTNKEIFLRELISNASDAIDKLYYRALTDKKLDIKQSDLEIKIDFDKNNRTLSISDNGCGMTEEELEVNLGTIAKSGSLAFKQENLQKESKNVDENNKGVSNNADINIIGQFGVGFYSAFMVSDTITVYSKSIDSEQAYKWTSSGADGYVIEPCNKETRGTTIVLSLKADNEDENYSKYLETYTIESLVKKYSDYIRYPIKMDVEHQHKKEGTEDEYETHIETRVINSQIPLWKKDKKVITVDEYKSFYTDKFYDFEEPLRWIHTKVEGQYSYSTLLYIPSHTPYDYYTKEYKKGLQLYSSGVLIMEKCEELLPDYFSFVKGLVDSEDLSLNISREMLQQDKQLRVIAKNIENKIKNELENMLENNREDYEKLFSIFGLQLKYGAYDNYGLNKEKLKDLLLFYSSYSTKYTTLKEYIQRLKDGQETIYYASGESIDKIKMMPQVENVLDKGYEVLYLNESVDEFVLQVLGEYEGKRFINVSANNMNLDTEEEKEALKKINEVNREMFEEMKKAIQEENKKLDNKEDRMEQSAVKEVRFTHRLKNHPVCLTSEGILSVEMEKVLNSMTNNKDVKAEIVLEINENHPISEKLKTLYKEDKEKLRKYTKILYAQARLIEGLQIDNPTEISNLICEMLG